MTKKYIFLFLSIFLGGLSIVVFPNYFLNPLTYSNSELAKAGAALESGKNIAFPEPTLDFRNLRRSHIEQMTETPEIVIFSGSRWQEATDDIAPGHDLYNAFVSSDHLEDMLAISELLHANNRMPKTLVLSVRYTTFDYVGQRGKSSWKSFSPQYRAMAKKLGVEPHPWIKTTPYNKWLNLLSLDALFENISGYSEIPILWKVTENSNDPLLDVIGSDGGLRFSGRHIAILTPEYVTRNAVENAAQDVKRRIEINPKSLEDLKRLLVFLQKLDVRVVFAQTPFHPEYYRRIKSSKYFEDIVQVEAEMNRISESFGLTVVGSFDPDVVGCGPEDFRDYHHANFGCVKRIFDQIQNL